MLLLWLEFNSKQTATRSLQWLLKLLSLPNVRHLTELKTVRPVPRATSLCMTERTHEIRIESHPRSFTEWSDLCSPAGYKKEVVRTSCNGVRIGRLDSLKDAGKHLGTAQMLGNGVWLNCSGWVGSLRMERICQREVLGRCLRNDVPTNWRACLFQWPFSSLEDFNELHWTLPIKRRRKKNVIWRRSPHRYSSLG